MNRAFLPISPTQSGLLTLRLAPRLRPPARTRNGGPLFAHSSGFASEYPDVAVDQARVIFGFHFAANQLFRQAHALFCGVTSQLMLRRLARALDFALRLLAELGNLGFR